ncbi:MAG TPA: SCO family protein [Solirubrobacteraceae bacterium]|nr:SCO family protein [Solirubrobacteraceae bacterium]
MHPRVRLAIIVLTGCAIAAVVAVAIARRSEHAERPPPAVLGPRTGFAGALRPAEIRPSDFALRDQDGKPASLRSYRGQVVILTFLYSTCRNTCPLTADQIRGALDQLGGPGVPALAISVDPAHDTPQLARRFLLERRLTGRMRFLLGSAAELAPIWRAYGIRPQERAFEHSAYVLLIDRRGRQRIGFPISKLTPEGLAHDIRALSAERAGRR